MIETILIPSCRAAVLIGGLFVLRCCLGNRISPTMRHAFWGLVPLALLPVAISSPVSLYNLLPQSEYESRERSNVERPDGFVASENAEGRLPTAGRQRAVLRTDTPEIFTVHQVHQSAIADATDRRSVAYPSEVVIAHEPQERMGGGNTEICPPVPDQEAQSTENREAHAVPLLSSRNLTIAALFVYLAGCFTMLVIFLRQVLLCRRWLAAATPVKSEEVLTLFETCCRQMKVKTWLVVSESPAVSGPFLIGVIRPTLLLPQGMISSAAPFRATPQQLRTVFLHELAHLKRWDVWIGWLATLLLVVHWFNPLLWLAIRRMNADREEATDALALKTLNASDRTAYAHSLLDIVEWCGGNHPLPPPQEGNDHPALPGTPPKEGNFRPLSLWERVRVRAACLFTGHPPHPSPLPRGEGTTYSSPLTPGLVGISETTQLLHRRIDMINQNRTWKLRWQMLAIFAAMLIGAATLTDAQERRPAAEIEAEIAERRQAIAEMRVDIGKLEAELLEAKVAEGIELDEEEMTVEFYPVARENLTLVTSTLQMLGRATSSEMMFRLEHDKNMLAVIGNKADHDKVREMLAQLERAQNPVIPAQAGIQTDGVNPASLDPRLRGGDGEAVPTEAETRRIVAYRLRNTLASDTVQKLTQLLPDDYSVQLTADMRNNRIIARGSERNLMVVEALLHSLDVPPSETAIKIFRIEHNNANELATMLKSLIHGDVEGEVPLRFVADMHTNSIIAAGSESDLAIVEALLKSLDVETATRDPFAATPAPLVAQGASPFEPLSPLATSEEGREIEGAQAPFISAQAGIQTYGMTPEWFTIQFVATDELAQVMHRAIREHYADSPNVRILEMDPITNTIGVSVRESEREQIIELMRTHGAIISPACGSTPAPLVAQGASPFEPLSPLATSEKGREIEGAQATAPAAGWVWDRNVRARVRVDAERGEMIVRNYHFGSLEEQVEMVNIIRQNIPTDPPVRMAAFGGNTLGVWASESEHTKIEELLAKFYEEPTFKAYPLTGNVEVVFELVRSLLGRSSALIRLDRNLLLVSGREADHEKIEAVFAQIYEGEEFSLRPYPALPGRSYDTILAFVEERLADSPEAKLIRHPRVTDSLSTRYPFHVWGRQSDHDKVQEILEQIEAEVRRAREGE